MTITQSGVCEIYGKKNLCFLTPKNCYVIFFREMVHNVQPSLCGTEFLF